MMNSLQTSRHRTLKQNKLQTKGKQEEKEEGQDERNSRSLALAAIHQHMQANTRSW